MTLEDVEDHIRKYTAEQEERLARQLRSIAEDCHAGRLWPVSIDGLQEIHRRLFDGVQGHAGRFRGRAFGDEHLIFGPNRSVHRDTVLREVEQVFADLERSLRSFVE